MCLKNFLNSPDSGNPFNDHSDSSQSRFGHDTLWIYFRLHEDIPGSGLKIPLASPDFGLKLPSDSPDDGGSAPHPSPSDIA
jgi:hypothetical protein